MEVSPHDPRIVYYGSQFVHRTRDGGVTWEKTQSRPHRPSAEGTQGASGEPITRDATGEEVYSTLYSIRESPLQKGLIWTGSNDGLIYVTPRRRQDLDQRHAQRPAARRARAEHRTQHRTSPAPPTSPSIAILLGDFTPFIYRTDDFGKTWTLPHRRQKRHRRR